MAEEATTAETKRLSFEDCERLLGHCWQMGFGSVLGGDGWQKEWCQHCPATRKKTLSDWSVAKSEPQDGS